MNKFSIKRLKVERRLRKIEKKLDRESINRKCYFYPSERKSCYHHIIPKNEGLKWIDLEANLLPIGQTAHSILHNHSNSDIKTLPRFKEYLEKMKRLNISYYNRYLLKLEK